MTSHLPFYRALSILLACLTLSACVNLEPRPDLTQYYRIYATSEAAEPPAGPQHHLALHAVMIPPWLDNWKLTWLTAPHAVHKAPFARWSEPLPNAIERVLDANLEHQPNIALVDSLPWDHDGIEARLRIALETLDAHTDGSIQMAAKWLYTAPDGSQAPARGEFSATWNPANPGTLAIAYSDLLKQLSEAIAWSLPPLSVKEKPE